MKEKVNFNFKLDNFSKQAFVESFGKIKDEGEIPICWKSYTPPKDKRKKKK